MCTGIGLTSPRLIEAESQTAESPSCTGPEGKIGSEIKIYEESLTFNEICFSQEQPTNCGLGTFPYSMMILEELQTKLEQLEISVNPRKESEGILLNAYKKTYQIDLALA
ncbi:hypothetical protein, partial [Candidatus Ichthyocystis sparus]